MFSGERDGWDTGTPRRILGMKAWQAGLLLAMSVLDCLVIVIGLAVVLGPKLGGPGEISSAASPSADGETPSQTPITMVFQFPTYTPFGAPAESPTPTREDWMEGWVKITVAEAEMWMPASYAAGDPHTEADAIIAALQDKGANYRWDFLREQMTGSDVNHVLWGIDSHQGNPAIVTNVAVIIDVPREDESLSEYVNRLLSEESEGLSLVNREMFAHPLYKAERLILLENDPENESYRYVLYSLADGDFIWNILCVTATDEIPERMGEFDQMAGSFRIFAAPE